uniref:Uncharacterized protein MANES_02G078600 n=1 Tax=Rhizophora mucronata TaxID=61149 RepID=A0A2P2M6N3_RHIMU
MDILVYAYLVFLEKLVAQILEETRLLLQLYDSGRPMSLLVHLQFLCH